MVLPAAEAGLLRETPFTIRQDRAPRTQLPKSILDEVSRRVEWAMNERLPYEREWEQAFNYFIGKQWGERPVAIDAPVVVNKFWPMVNSALPTLFYQNPRMYVSPMQKWAYRIAPDGTELQVDAEANARSAEAAVDGLWRNQELKYETRSTIVDAFIFAVGWMKVGFSSPKGIPDDDIQQSQISTEALQIMQRAVPGITQREFLRLSGKGNLLDFDTNIRPGSPHAFRVNPMHVWVDPKADKLRNARFMVYKWETQIRSLNADPLFSNLDDIVPEGDEDSVPDDSYRIPGVRTNFSRPPEQVGQTEDPVKSVWVYEYYDKERRKVYWLLKQPPSRNRLGGWRVIRMANWPHKEIPDFPFVPLMLNQVPNRFYPLTGIQQWLPQQRELNIIRTVKLDHTRRQNRKILVEEGAISADQEAMLLNPAVYGLVKVRPNTIAQKRIGPLESGTIPIDLYRIEEEIRRDIADLSGFLSSPTMQGQAQRPGITATEAGQIGAAIGTLSEDALGLVSDYAAKLSKYLFLIFREFWTQEQMMLRHNGRDGKEWVRVAPDSLQGDFEFKIEVGSTQKQSAEVRQKRAVELMTLVTNPVVVQLFGPELVQRVLEWVFRAYDIAFPEALFEGAKEHVLPVDRGKMMLQELQHLLRATGGGNSGAGAAGRTGPAQGAFQPNQAGGGPVTPLNQMGGQGTAANVAQGQGGGRQAA